MASAADPSMILFTAARAGDRRALARLISRVEDHPEEVEPALARIYPSSGAGRIVGVTGAPGSGKSSLIDRFISLARAAGRTVAVVAVDPSSPFSGGALLGDRVRMQDHVTDDGVYVRSMSSRGHLGGLADASGKVAVVLGAAGFDLVLVETVGVGQSEVEVVETADTVVVVTAPGMGDEIQAAKAGLFEIGDVFAVNKSDRPGAADTVADLRQMIELGAPHSWEPPVVACSAATGDGVSELWSAIARHGEHLAAPDRSIERRRRRATMQIRRAAAARLDRTLTTSLDPALVDDVAHHRLDPWTAANRVLGH